MADPGLPLDPVERRCIRRSCARSRRPGAARRQIELDVVTAGWSRPAEVLDRVARPRMRSGSDPTAGSRSPTRSPRSDPAPGADRRPAGRVYAMCAIDALGMSAMLGEDTLIASVDVTTGPPTVTVTTARRTSWDPAEAVVFVGADAGGGPSADCCCDYVNFFTDAPRRARLDRRHPQIPGQILTQAEAEDLGARLFGHLLAEADPGRAAASMIVLGGGAIGLELGQLFARLGVGVSIVEALPRLAAAEEPEVWAVINRALRDEGIAISAGTAVTAARRGRLRRDRDRHPGPAAGPSARRAAAGGHGRRPATAALRLDAVGVPVGPGGQIEVDEQLRTAHPRIWAAGNVTGGPQFVYRAAAHGTIAARSALGGAGRAMDYRALPCVTFTAPGIASGADRGPGDRRGLHVRLSGAAARARSPRSWTAIPAGLSSWSPMPPPATSSACTSPPTPRAR